jgi:hypothetical protein
MSEERKVKKPSAEARAKRRGMKRSLELTSRLYEPELISSDENIVVLKPNGKTIFFTCNFQIALDVSYVDLWRNR